MYSGLVGHFEKRSLKGMEYVDPAQLDLHALVGYFEQHADPFTRKHLDKARGFYDREFPRLPESDDFSRTGMQDASETKALFVDRFYIGCEAYDHSVAWAFNDKLNPYGAKIRAMFGSDVGHWDVTDVGDVVVEAYELVEDGFISEEGFKEFMFWNPAELHAGMNSDFFKGTVLESDVDKFLKTGRKH